MLTAIMGREDLAGQQYLMTSNIQLVMCLHATLTILLLKDVVHTYTIARL